MNYADLLHQKGLRVTALRLEFLNLLSTAGSPKTVAEMMILLNKKGFKPNKTSLYRQIASLLEAKLLHEVHLRPGIVHYEIQLSHHHHFVCEQCADIQCIENQSLELAIHSLQKTMRERGVTVREHAFSLLGLCQKCTS